MVLPTLERAGMEVMAANLARALVRRGHDVGFTCLERIGPLGQEMEEAGLRVTHVPAPGLLPNLLPGALRRWFRSFSPDVVHIHSGVWLKAAAGARAAGVPRVIGTLHGIYPDDPAWSRWVLRAAAARMDMLVAVSDSLRQFAQQMLHVRSDRTIFIPNGIPLSRFATRVRSAGFRRRVGIPEDRPVVGIVARLDPVKNHMLLLDAFARVHSERPDLFLLIVGDGPLRPAVERSARERGLQDSILVTGVVNDPAPYYHEMDVFVLPSAIEGLSMSILEALAAGVPIVATAVGGTPDLLAGGKYGRLVPPSDAGALAREVGLLLNDAQLRSHLATLGQDLIRQRYSDDSMAQAYEDVYLCSPGSSIPTRAIACAE
jgi:glycosyltransferase involved in cell wall biosynthesis